MDAGVTVAVDVGGAGAGEQDDGIAYESKNAGPAETHIRDV